MAQQLKGTLTVINNNLTGIFKSADGATTYTFEAKDIPSAPVDIKDVNAVLDVVEPNILEGPMGFRGVIGPSAIEITMDRQEIVILAQLSQAVEPPVNIVGVGIWTQSSD